MLGSHQLLFPEMLYALRSPVKRTISSISRIDIDWCEIILVQRGSPKLLIYENLSIKIDVPRS